MAAKTQSNGLAASIAAASDAIQAKRLRIGELQAALETLETAGVNADAVEGRVDRAIAAAQARGLPTIGGLQARVEGDWQSQFNRSAAGHSDPGGSPATIARPFDFFAILTPDALRSALLAGVINGTISESERATKTAEAEAELLSAECSEELMCRGFDAVIGRGSEFPRRPDARPDILCAPDHELETACAS